MNFRFSYRLTSAATGPETSAKSATGVLHVDSVADLPSADSEATGRTEAGDSLLVEAPVIRNGWATQTAEDNGAVPVTFKVTADFYDLDGSETGSVDILLPQGFSVPPGSPYEEFSDDLGLWARILITDLTVNNNYASTSAANSVAVHTITSVPELHAAVTFENNRPYEHLGDEAKTGPGRLSLTGMDPGEKLAELTMAWDGTLGELDYNGAAIGNGVNTIDGVRFTCASGTLTLAPDTASSVDGIVGKLSYVPKHTFSDHDDALTYRGVIVDTASGETRTFGPEGSGSAMLTVPVPVIVDAVAQRPADAGGAITYPDAWTAAHNQITVTATATFFDVADGSETHYLLIEAKNYFTTMAGEDSDGISRTSIAFSGNGQPLSPNGSGGWLNPGPSASTDQNAAAATAKTFFRIPVDDLMAAHQGDPADDPQADGNFIITRHTDGSFTISYNTTVYLTTTEMTADFQDQVLTGGMAQEGATQTGGDGSGGGESYLYNNTAYNLVQTPLEVAVVGTSRVTVLAGRATEDNSPLAHTDRYYEDDNGTAMGAGILAVRTDPGLAGQDYANEQITLSFTYNSLYKDAATGEWIIPGAIVYTFLGGTEPDTRINPSTGLVTVTVVIHPGDTDSVAGRAAPNPDPDTSHIRFIPGLKPGGDPTNPADYLNNYNETDISLGCTAMVRDLASGATASVGGNPLLIPIDAVANQPSILNLGWEYGEGGAGGSHTAFSGGNVTLRFTAFFPDNGAEISEGQYILIRQNGLMDLSPDFKAEVVRAGYTIQDYVVAEDTAPYYRIPAAFFQPAAGADAGEHSYDVILPMTMTGGVSDQVITSAVINEALRIYAQAIVEQAHGQEFYTGNNAATVTGSLPDLSFAVVDSTVNPSGGMAYEQNQRDPTQGSPAPPR